MDGSLWPRGLAPRGRRQEEKFTGISPGRAEEIEERLLAGATRGGLAYVLAITA
jgi:hypothetical protein